MTRQTFSWWVPLTVLAVLIFMESWKLTLPDPSEGIPYRAKVRQIVSSFPKVAGEWEGTDSPLPQEAIALLHANVYICRDYLNARTQQRVGLLFMEVEDSRDMMGHYPPNCYPGNGWVLQKSVNSTWVVDGLEIPGVEYEFKKEVKGHGEWKTVRDFFVLPDGKFYPEIASFGRAASAFAIRPYGATQVQVIYDWEYLPEDREAIFQSLIRAHMSLIDAVRRKDY